MALEPSDVLLESVFCQLDADTPRSLHDLKGDPRANLLAIRLLFRQGRITGVLLDDPSGAEDQHGPFSSHAARGGVRRGYRRFPWPSRSLAGVRRGAGHRECCLARAIPARLGYR
nr:hypothetical protein [Pseudomonas aeruginosa]